MQTLSELAQPIVLIFAIIAIQLIRKAGSAHQKFRAQEASITGLNEYDF